MMKYLVRYVIEKPFTRKHNVMEVDYCYRIKNANPIFEYTEGVKKNTRYLITIQHLRKAHFFASEAAPGIWKPIDNVKAVFDGKKRHMGNVKISWYYYYSRDKSSLRTVEWHMRKYYLHI